MGSTSMSIDLSTLEQQFGLPSGLLSAVQQTESGGDPNAVSPKGALGSFQFMPATAAQYGIDPKDPDQAATGAAVMYSDLLNKYNGDVPSALAAYNWGQGNVDKKGLQNAPDETKDYIGKVMTAMEGQPSSSQSDRGSISSSPLSTALSTIGNAIVPSANAAEMPNQDDDIPPGFVPEQSASKENVDSDIPPGFVPQEQVSQNQQPSLGDQALRQVGLAARDIGGVPARVIAGVGDIANQGINAATGALNKYAGTDIPQLGMPSDTVKKGLKALGLPEPENGIEKGVETAADVLLGGGEGAVNAVKTATGNLKNMLTRDSSGIQTSQAAKDVASKFYDQADAMGGVVDNPTPIMDSMKGKDAVTPTEIAISKSDPVRQFLNEFSDVKNSPMTLSDAQKLDQELSNRISDEYDTTGLSSKGQKLLDAQTKFRAALANTPPESVGGGAEGYEAWKNGQKAWQQAMKLQDLEKIQRAADLSPTPGTIVSSRLRTLLTNNSRMRGYSQDEISALNKAAKRGTLEDAFHTFGSRLLPMGASLVGESIGGLPGAAIGAIVGHGGSSLFRGAATAIKNSKMSNAAKTIGKSIPND